MESLEQMQARRDMWLALYEQKKTEYMLAGMSAEDAEERAVREVRQQLRAGQWPETKTSLLPACRCLNCGLTMEGVTDAFGDAAPGPGDATVCWECGHVMCFTDELTLRELTDQEMLDIAGDARLLAMQRMRGAVKK